MMADIIPFSESPPEPEGSVTNMLLELFLNHKFWVDHNHMVNQKYFEKESKKIYDVLTDAHEKYEGDLSVTELEALLWSKNHSVVPY
jgi:hypothetical protein